MKKLLALVLLCLLTLAPAAWAALDLNSADQKSLETLNGIGPAKAAAIIEYRKANGPFNSVEELLKIKGIGPAVLEKIRDQVDAAP